jgi:hypothetical protein
LITLTGLTYSGRSGNVYDLFLGSIGLAGIDYYGPQEVRLTVSYGGKTKTTEFNCEDGIDNMF